jgi:hypothetical protein
MPVSSNEGKSIASLALDPVGTIFAFQISTLIWNIMSCAKYTNYGSIEERFSALNIHAKLPFLWSLRFRPLDQKFDEDTKP